MIQKSLRFQPILLLLFACLCILYLYRKPKVILVTQYYQPTIKGESPDEEARIRQSEINTCLIHNLDNPMISEIHLFVDKPDYNFPQICRNNPNISKIKVVYSETRLSFRQAFEYCNGNIANRHIKVLSNSDIYFDHTIDHVRDVKQKQVFAITRHDLVDEQIQLIPNHRGSQDVWVWRGRVNITDDTFDDDGVILGQWACDNRIVALLRNSGYAVVNPCQLIKCIHLHKNAEARGDMITYEGDLQYVPCMGME